MTPAQRLGALATIVVAAGLVLWLALRDPSPPASADVPLAGSSVSSSGPPPSATPAPAPSANAPPPTGSVRLAPAPVYAALEDGFEITFPSLAPPTIDRGRQELGGTSVPLSTYYVTYGASAFSVAAARHTHARVAASTPTALVRETRDAIIAHTGAKLVGERPFDIQAAGRAWPGLYQELTLPRGLRALYAIVFVCDVAYMLSAAGPAGDPSLDAGLFAGFVSSFKVTKTFGCPPGR